MFKKPLYILLALTMMFALAACAGVKIPSVSASSNSNQPQTQRTFSLANQPLENKLAMGTLKLEGTPQAVTPQEAQTLLPLWRAVKSLSQSNNASAAEIQALYTQIEGSMTPDQISAIKNLNMTQADFTALMQQYGIQGAQNGGNFGNLTADQRATRIAQFQSQGGGTGGNRGNGGGFGGGFPGGGGFSGGNGGNNAQPNVQRTPNPNRVNRGGLNFLFVDPLITLLQQRAGA